VHLPQSKRARLLPVAKPPPKARAAVVVAVVVVAAAAAVVAPLKPVRVPQATRCRMK
jgi:hypothetical protein